jgi:hypothetical protein
MCLHNAYEYCDEYKLWLMKNGAKVRCKGSRQFVGHYDYSLGLYG